MAIRKVIMPDLVQALDSQFRQSRNSTKAQWQEAYMKRQFIFLGIPRPIRAQLEKDIFKNYALQNQEELIETIKLLWQKDEREFQYTACELALYYKKFWDQNLLKAFEYMIRAKSWWDTVDDIAVNLVGSLLLISPELLSIIDLWIHDSNLWIRRTALLHQLRWKDKTNKNRLFSYCAFTMHEKEFFIRKAIGWALRQYSKTDKKAVSQFIAYNYKSLSKLSIKEGSKYI